jgi:hypothetical protein
MGNTELKSAFKNVYKDEYTSSLDLTYELLDEANLVELVYHQAKDKMAVDIDLPKVFPETNNQTNENDDGLHRQKLLAEISENYIAGFATAESNLESLKNPSKPPSPNQL